MSISVLPYVFLMPPHVKAIPWAMGMVSAKANKVKAMRACKAKSAGFEGLSGKISKVCGLQGKVRRV